MKAKLVIITGRNLRAGRFNGGVVDVFAEPPLLDRKRNDQNAILGGRARSARRARSGHKRRSLVRPVTTATMSAQYRDADRQQEREGECSSFRKAQRETDRRREQLGRVRSACPSARRLFLERGPGPFVAVARSAGSRPTCAPSLRALGRNCSPASVRRSRPHRGIRCSESPFVGLAPAWPRPARGAGPSHR